MIRLNFNVTLLQLMDCIHNRWMSLDELAIIFSINTLEANKSCLPRSLTRVAQCQLIHFTLLTLSIGVCQKSASWAMHGVSVLQMIWVETYRWSSAVKLSYIIHFAKPQRACASFISLAVFRRTKLNYRQLFCVLFWNNFSHFLSSTICQ